MNKEQLLAQADEISDQIAQLTEQERDLRKKAAEIQSPKKVWEKIINGLVIKIDREKYPNSIFFFKGDEIFFELENSTLWCRYDKAWSTISVAIPGDYNATQAFIKNQIEEHFRMKGVTPHVNQVLRHYR